MRYIYWFIAILVVVRFGRIKAFMSKLVEFSRWKYRDARVSMAEHKAGIQRFKEFGLKIYTGRQGDGKTVSLVNRLNELHDIYPKAKIYTNFRYRHATGQLSSLNDLLTIRNGDDGVIFGIDEIQNEFSSNTSKDFPETLLGTITMQRKQHVVILSTSQVFTRVAKPLREQCFEVIECRTFGGRWTRQRCYDADDYNYMIDQTDPQKKYKVRRKWKSSFIQTDDIRNCYDTLEVIQRLSRHGFAPKIRINQ